MSNMATEPQYLTDAVWSVSASWWLVVGLLLVAVLALRWRRHGIGAARQSAITGKAGLRLLASHKTVQIYHLELNGVRFLFVQSPQALLQLDPDKASVLISDKVTVDGADK